MSYISVVVGTRDHAGNNQSFLLLPSRSWEEMASEIGFIYSNANTSLVIDEEQARLR